MDEEKQDEAPEGRNKWNLIKRVTETSKTTNWLEAKKEWVVDSIYHVEDPEEFETCICGHYPIKEVIVIKNKHNGKTLIVGKCCINKFPACPSDYNNFFQAIRNKKINLAVIEQGFEDKVINEWEHGFTKNVWRKRKLTEKQQNKYSEIKQRLLNYYQRKGISA